MNLSIKKITLIALSVVLLVIAITYSGKLFEGVDTGEIVVIQHPLSGQLDVYTTPGTYPQYLGTATHYKKRTTIWFSNKTDQGTTDNQSIKIRFNDGGHAEISGSTSMELPSVPADVIKFHTYYGSQAALEHDLATTVIEKAIFMTGPLMSSKESYAEKRNDLISYISDQASNGIYKTTQKDVTQTDALTLAEKVVTVVNILKDAKGNVAREDISPVQKFHIALTNLSINSIVYDTDIEKQIKSQQELIMQVQTSIANAKKSEQEALTVEQQGKADAAKAKWDQEVIKAKAVTEAQQNKEVAELEVKTAALNKQRDILDGEASAKVKQLEMSANGALEQRLDAWVKVNTAYATALTNATWVPTNYYGGISGANGGKGASFDPSVLPMILMSQFATQLKVDPTPKK